MRQFVWVTEADSLIQRRLDDTRRRQMMMVIGAALLVMVLIIPKASAQDFPASFELSTLDGSNGFTLDSGSFFITEAVSPVGDINGDGVADIAIGAPRADPGGRRNAGSTFVVFGKLDGFTTPFDLTALDGTNGFVINGVVAGDQAGFLVSTAGDINGDGVADLIIGGTRRLSNHVVFGIFATTGPTTVFSSVLPTARAGFVGGPPITVFFTGINAGINRAQNCSITIPGTAPASLNYQQTNAVNAPLGLADEPFALNPGQVRSFILAFTPTSTSTGEEVFPDIACDNANVAAIPGVNTVFLSIDNVAVPDILSIGATPSGIGIITVPAGGTSFMTASATNIGVGDAAGSADTAVTVSVDTGAAALGLLLQLCETDASSTCITPLGSTPVNTVIGAVPSFFAVFATDQASGGIALDPANARVFLRFKDAAGTTLSVTSAAVTLS